MNYAVNWEIIKQNREKFAFIANNRENSKRLNHVYKIDDQILIVLDRVVQGAKLNGPTEEPYSIIEVYDNSRVKIERDILLKILVSTASSLITYNHRSMST